MGVPEDVTARITAVDACPAINAGAGRVVLTTVSHPNDDVHELVLRGPGGQSETLGVTGWHKFRREGVGAEGGWTSVRNLREGDVLRAHSGETVTVERVTSRPGTERVYNLTVETDHVYHVGNLDTLTHNNERAPLTPLDLTGHRSTHILNRHRHGTGISDKIEFPAHWTDEDIVNYVSDVASDASPITHFLLTDVLGRLEVTNLQGFLPKPATSDEEPLHRVVVPQPATTPEQNRTQNEGRP